MQNYTPKCEYYQFVATEIRYKVLYVVLCLNSDLRVKRLLITLAESTISYHQHCLQYRPYIEPALITSKWLTISKYSKHKTDWRFCHNLNISCNDWKWTWDQIMIDGSVTSTTPHLVDLAFLFTVIFPQYSQKLVSFLCFMSLLLRAHYCTTIFVCLYNMSVNSCVHISAYHWVHFVA